MCERLAYEGDALHHKRSIRNVVRVEVSPEPILLIGVGLYTGNEEELFDPDAHITFDRTTTTVNIWCSVSNDKGREVASLVASKSITMNTEEAKIIAKQKVQNKIPNAQTQWLDEPVLLMNNRPYEVEHPVLPTDVVNHYSGWPVTNLGADLWTCYGSTNSPIVKSDKTMFTFSEPLLKPGRSCVMEGQIPYLIFWRLNL